MTMTTVSSKFQVVIPREIREALGIRPGMRYQVLAIGDRVELVPVKDIRQLRGMVPGIDSEVPRERDDRV